MRAPKHGLLMAAKVCRKTFVSTMMLHYAVVQVSASHARRATTALQAAYSGANHKADASAAAKVLSQPHYLRSGLSLCCVHVAFRSYTSVALGMMQGGSGLMSSVLSCRLS